jgi:hypothetical protein
MVISLNSLPCPGRVFYFIVIDSEMLEKSKNFDIIYIITIYEMRMSWSILSH